MVYPAVFQQEHFHGDQRGTLIAITERMRFSKAIAKPPSELRDGWLRLTVKEVAHNSTDSAL